ncbi:MAG: hypothetical protein P8P98_02540, partial [Emcibacteraceae bacterium]|nr:hypothetical protein [Emcibacteraceae bacterium]
RNRCNVFESHPTLVSSAMMTGELAMPTDIACNILREQSTKFYLMVAKNSPRANELVTRLNNAIIKLRNTGQWKAVDEGFFPVSNDTQALLNCM